MGLFDRKAAKKSRDAPKTAQPVAYHRADRYMIGYESIFAAVSRIATTIAMLPMHLIKDYEIQKRDPLERLVSFSPNSYMTGYVFRQTMQTNVGNEGNAYALIVPDMNGDPLRLDVLDPARVRPWIDTDTQELWYQYTPLRGAKILWIHDSSMIVLQYISASGERGIRPIDVLFGTLKYDRDVREFSVKQLDSNSNCVLLTVPNSGLNVERRAEIIKEFMNVYDETGGRVMVLDGGITADTLSTSPVDPQVLNVERITTNRVATVYNIPPHLLGDYSGTSFSSQEQQSTEFLQFTIQPIVTQWVEQFNRKLLTFDRIADGESFHLDTEVMLRGDFGTMADYYQKSIRGANLTPNEARKKQGKKPLPGGDDLLASRDLLPLSMIVQGKTLTAKEDLSERILEPGRQ